MNSTFAGEGQPITPTSSPQRTALRRPNPPPPKPVETTPNAREDVAVLRQPNIRLTEAKPASKVNSTPIEFSTISSSSVHSLQAQSSVSRVSSIKQKYPEWNTDYYVPILTALGTSDWKNTLKLRLDELNEQRFSAELVYEGKTYRGVGQGKNLATNDAAFHLVCLLDTLDNFLENNCLAILEFAVRHGCTFKRELIQVVKLSEQEFQCQYNGPDGIVVGEITKSKTDAKKNLVFKLLAPLWKSLKLEIERIRTHGRDTTTLHDEIDKLESQRDEEPRNEEPRNEEPRNEVEPHVYEESLVSGYKTEAPKSADAIDNVIEKAREVLSGLELMRDQIGKNTGPSGDVPPSGYETGQNRSTAATTGEDIVPVSLVDSKWASTDLGIDDSISKICANRK